MRGAWAAVALLLAGCSAPGSPPHAPAPAEAATEGFRADHSRPTPAPPVHGLVAGDWWTLQEHGERCSSVGHCDPYTWHVAAVENLTLEGSRVRAARLETVRDAGAGPLKETLWLTPDGRALLQRSREFRGATQAWTYHAPCPLRPSALDVGAVETAQCTVDTSTPEHGESSASEVHEYTVEAAGPANWTLGHLQAYRIRSGPYTASWYAPGACWDARVASGYGSMTEDDLDLVDFDCLMGRSA